MKHRYYAILGLLFLASLTACGTDGTVVETYRDPKDDTCYVELHVNVQGGEDSDYKAPIPCLITSEAP